MELKWIDKIEEQIKAGALCIGAFDGIHLGHKALINKTIEKASSCKAYGLSFSPHPREFFYKTSPEGKKPFKRICTEQINASIARSLGLEELLFVEFNQELSNKTTEQFLSYVRSYIEFSALVVGFDFRLGSQRKGGLEELSQWCDNNGVEFVAVEKVSHSNQKVSSTLVREALSDGNFKLVEELLGHSYFLEGQVIKDQGLGRRMGFATLNVKLPNNLVIKNGVYSAMAQIETREHPAVINLGYRPTVEDKSDVKTLEVHILNDDFNGTVDAVKVHLKKFLRPERKFDNLQDLSLQIQKDIRKSKDYFGL